MQPPAHILRRLREIDPLLLVRWNPQASRWEILRRDRFRPGNRPFHVRFWCRANGTKYGRYLPLDNRLIAWLLANDLGRRFKGRDEKHWSRLVEKELADRQERAQSALRERRDERREELVDMLAFAIERGDRGRPVSFGRGK